MSSLSRSRCLLSAFALMMVEGACADVTPPEVTLMAPGADAVLVAADVVVEARIADDGDVEAILLVDGAEVDRSALDDDCEERCVARLRMSTGALPNGEHELTVIALDGGGNEARDGAVVTLAETIFVERVRFTNEADDGFYGGGLEVEAHLRDADDGTFLGCTADGMASVVQQNVTYDVLSGFVRPLDESPLLLDDLRDRSLVVRVVENDDSPCPAEDTGADDDLFEDEDDRLGTSLPFALDDLPAELAFDDVPILALDVGRIGD
jgi:hypothetical protein